MLRNQAPYVPVVVLTGLNDESVGIGAVQHGAQDYLIEGSRNFHRPKTSCLIFQTERCFLRALAWCSCTVTPMAAKSQRLF